MCNHIENEGLLSMRYWIYYTSSHPCFKHAFRATQEKVTCYLLLSSIFGASAKIQRSLRWEGEGHIDPMRHQQLDPSVVNCPINHAETEFSVPRQGELRAWSYIGRDVQVSPLNLNR